MTTPVAKPPSSQTSWVIVAIAWTLVGIPLAWGIYRTLRSALILFK
jgi:hypothetical protein